MKSQNSPLDFGKSRHMRFYALIAIGMILLGGIALKAWWILSASLKVITGIDAMEARTTNDFVNRFLSVNPPFNGTCRFYGDKGSDLKDLQLPNQKTILTPLSNHGNHPIDGPMNNLQGALAKSYNVYFGYLGLLLNRTIMFDSNDIERPNQFWWRVFVGEADRINDFPLIGLAERLGYNRTTRLMPTGKNISAFPIPDFLNTRAGYFPINMLNQTPITRSVIARSGAIHTVNSGIDHAGNRQQWHSLSPVAHS